VIFKFVLTFSHPLMSVWYCNCIKPWVPSLFAISYHSTWATRIVNAYHFFQKNYVFVCDRTLVYSEEKYRLKAVAIEPLADL